MRIVRFAFFVVALAVSPAFANIIVYSGTLSNAGEGSGSPGTGTATVTIDTVANTMEVAVSFSGLTSGTTASHIHCCTATAGSGSAGVATTTPTFPGFPLGVTSGTYDQTFDLTLASTYNSAFDSGATPAQKAAALEAGLAAGEAYLNIHTSAFPGGEIRAFLTAPAPVPEPSSLMLVATGLAGFVGVIRRKLIR